MKSHGEEPESHDEVIREVRRIKEELAAAQGFDIRRICEEARKNQRTQRKNWASYHFRAAKSTIETEMNRLCDS